MISPVDKPVRGSRSGRPIMALLDLLGRRWTMRVIWELREAPLSFRALQAACAGMSPSVLNQRLAELREALLVEQGDAGYQLSALGRSLLEQFAPLERWAQDWAAARRRGS
ncbi:winged helix-turn-helix transcriptional regulator [Solimonas soli]|uniref:winged helix-turn-helix transcriptional regulator n=1 Tax=Solimonas soli TaxID=413479 RepID=UPI000487653F|nr:helix-turn-helix domain-containing protein [Solimonas soli]